MGHWFKDHGIDPLLLLKKAIETVRIKTTIPLDTFETKELRRKFRREHRN